MDYIVNPSWFYWASVFQDVKIFVTLFGCLSVVGFPIGCTIYISEMWDDDDDKEKRVKKIGMIGVTVGLVLILIGIFIPSKETMLQMQIARLATGDNVEMVLQRIMDMAKEIIEATK